MFWGQHETVLGAYFWFCPHSLLIVSTADYMGTRNKTWVSSMQEPYLLYYLLPSTTKAQVLFSLLIYFRKEKKQSSAKIDVQCHNQYKNW